MFEKKRHGSDGNTYRIREGWFSDHAIGPDGESHRVREDLFGNRRITTKDGDSVRIKPSALDILSKFLE